MARQARLGKWTSSSAEGRWGPLGPYYAMFPIEHVREIVGRFCPEPGSILDPFCGRGTVPFVAGTTGRPSLGIDLNPVAYVYSSAKVDPEPRSEKLIKRIREIAASIRSDDHIPENEFQKWAWCEDALAFLRAARRELDWKRCRADRTLMAVILVHLHGKLGNAISNQLRQSKSMSPDYSVGWWKDKNMPPPEIDPVSYFIDKVNWRYGKGIAPMHASVKIIHADCRSALQKAAHKFSMLLTSPPYMGVTNYRVDNWIRLWMLGEQAEPSWEVSQRYGNRPRYAGLILDSFACAKRNLTPNAVIYVRTDSRAYTRNVTLAALLRTWPLHIPYEREGIAERSQTSLFGDHSTKPGETDFLLLHKSCSTTRPFRFRRVKLSQRRQAVVEASLQGADLSA